MKAKAFAVVREEKQLFIAIISIFLIGYVLRIPAVSASWLFTGIILVYTLFIIIASSFSVVRHAGILAYRFGEPYGTMILTLSAVTVEIIMISTMMFHDDPDPTLARDTIYSTLMFLINGFIGFIMLIGGLKFGEQPYNIKSTNSFISMIIGLTGLALFLPIFVPETSKKPYEMLLVVCMLVLYAFFIRIQASRHSYFFSFKGRSEVHLYTTRKKSEISGLYHTTLLFVIILTIAILAEDLSVTLDNYIDWFNLPDITAGLIIALIIIAPESLTAIRAGLSNDMQRVMNIVFGSALSTSALTIPAVLIIAFIRDKDIILSFTSIQACLVFITLTVSILSCKEGETNALQGFIHLILFFAFVFLSFV